MRWSARKAHASIFTEVVDNDIPETEQADSQVTQDDDLLMSVAKTDQQSPQHNAMSKSSKTGNTKASKAQCKRRRRPTCEKVCKTGTSKCLNGRWNCHYAPITCKTGSSCKLNANVSCQVHSKYSLRTYFCPCRWSFWPDGKCCNQYGIWSTTVWNVIRTAQASTHVEARKNPGCKGMQQFQWWVRHWVLFILLYIKLFW